MVRIIGNTTALRRITLEKREELLMYKEVIFEILSKIDKHGLATSVYAPPGADLADKLHREKLQAKKDTLMPMRTVCHQSKDENAACGTDAPSCEVRRLAPTESKPMKDDKRTMEPNTGSKVEATGIHHFPGVIEPQPSVSLRCRDSIDNKDKGTADVKADEKAKSARTSVLSRAAASFVPCNDHAPKPMEADSNEENASTKSTEEPESGVGKEPLVSRLKSSRSQGVANPSDFMAQFHKLRKQKEKAAKAAAAGPVRRVVFSNLPEWATISSILQLVYGGAIERAWTEDGDIVVQFVEKSDCERYHEEHSSGINYVTGDGEQATISVTLPEDGLPDNVELSARVAEGASRVVRLAGLPAGHKDSDSNSILGVVSQPGWEGKMFERVLITQAGCGVDVAVTFYDLHDGWQFLQDIMEGTYDCLAKYEVDPCARASTYHFIEEPNPAFEFVTDMD